MTAGNVEQPESPSLTLKCMVPSPSNSRLSQLHPRERVPEYHQRHDEESYPFENSEKVGNPQRMNGNALGQTGIPQAVEIETLCT